MSFANLRKRKSTVDIAALVGAATKDTSSNRPEADKRMWQPAVDKAGNGYAVIRFLPARDEEGLPWARYWDHGFKGPTGKWYIEKSLTSIGLTDPVGEMNTKLWNSGFESDKEIVKERKRKLHYVSNILVITDTANPENEGQVFMFNYGKKIFDKIMDVMQPQFPDETPINPFDFWEGADFTLKIRQVDGYRNYDKSEFSKPKELFGGDEEKLEATFNKMYDLSEFTDPKNYKSYEELSAQLAKVLGESVAPKSTVKSEIAKDMPKAEAPKYKTAEAAYDDEEDYKSDAGAPMGMDDEEDDTLSYFAKLAKES